MTRSVHGILLVDKLAGISSNTMLQKIKRLFSAKKAGHTGSLDPIATGLLPICLGEATKFSRFLLEADKHYLVCAKLGITTTTGDVAGEPLRYRPVPTLDLDQLEASLDLFRGLYEQIPPMYSALKHEGQPLYKLARAGIVVPRKARRVEIKALILKEFKDDELTLEIKCSKGTYIRTLVEDLGEAIGCGAHVIMLKRLGVGFFEAKQMVSFDQIMALGRAKAFQKLDQLLLPIECLATQSPCVTLSETNVSCVQNGQIVHIPGLLNPGLVRLVDTSQRFLGMGEVLEDGRLVPRRLLAFTKAFQ